MESADIAFPRIEKKKWNKLILMYEINIRRAHYGYEKIHIVHIVFRF